MEALFSADANADVTYRLSVNAANYVRLPCIERLAMFDWVRKCYEARSRLVHGGSRMSVVFVSTLG